MTYSYKCPDNHTTEIKQNITEETLSTIVCPECGKQAVQDWKDKAFIVPDYMKSVSDYNRDNGANFSYIKNRMNYSPTGKRKICYRGGGVNR